MIENLLPCPFCGGAAKLYYPPIVLGDDSGDTDYMQAVCTKCHIVKPRVRFRDYNKQSPEHQAAKAKCISAWNRRIPVDNAIEALRPFVEAGPPTGPTRDEGWLDNRARERIVDWFGPSDFILAREVFASLGGIVEE
jgi:Lar family restriction alleviation protein